MDLENYAVKRSYLEAKKMVEYVDLDRLTDYASFDVDESISNGLQHEIATHFYGDSILLPTSKSGTSILIPGLNLGPAGTAIWLLTILTATIFHELGHYIAAKCFNVPILETSIFIMPPFIPGASVTVDERKLLKLSHLKQYDLAVLGAWHNLVLFIASMLLLSELPNLLSVGYQKTGEVIVLKCRGSRMKGSLITNINNIPMKEGVRDFIAAIEDFAPVHRCVPKSQQPNECCESGLIHMKKASCIWDSESLQYYHAISVHQKGTNVISKFCATSDSDFILYPLCNFNSDCGSNEFCGVKFHPKESIVLDLVFRDLWSSGIGSASIVGTRESLSRALLLTELIPRKPFLPISFPVIVEIILRYTASINIGLCLVNILPAFRLDGALAMKSILSHSGIKSGKFYKYFIVMNSAILSVSALSLFYSTIGKQLLKLL